MTRTTAAVGSNGKWEDDTPYNGVLKSAVIEKSKNAQYPDPQLKVVWEGTQGAELTDYLGLKLGISNTTGLPSKLRQMLNALAGKDKNTEVWFDPDTLEWGYDLSGDDSTPAFNKLTPGGAGMALVFMGENVPKPKPDDPKRKVFKITKYRIMK